VRISFLLFPIAAPLSLANLGHRLIAASNLCVLHLSDFNVVVTNGVATAEMLEVSDTVSLGEHLQDLQLPSSLADTALEVRLSGPIKASHELGVVLASHAGAGYLDVDGIWRPP
jgi:hypothetical protein